MLGIAVAVALLIGALLLVRKLERDATIQNERTAREQAERAASDAATGLERLLALFQRKAQNAAVHPKVQTLLGSSTDDRTVRDALSTEAWADPFRDRGGAVAIFAGGGAAVVTATMVDPAALRAIALAAQTEGEAASLVPHLGVFLVAGVRLPFPLGDGSRGSIVLSRPAGQDELDALGALPLLFTDGKVRIAARGDTSGLESLVGHEAVGHRVLPRGVASARQVGAVWVWALQPLGAEVVPAVPPVAVWGICAALAVGVLALSLRLGRGGQVPPRTETLPYLSPNAPATAVASRSPAPAPAAPAPEDDALENTSPSHGGQTRYIVVAPLGEGGMARVSVAVSHGAEGFRRLFVLKRLKPQLTDNPEIVAQFIDEARLGASLVHSNVVPVFDFGRDREGYFMAQEYIMGRDLEAVRHTLFEQHRATLDPGLVLYVAQEALKALSYAHGKTDDEGRHLRLVHRDVSPNNLMISARGELKLLDFGIVKAEGKLSQTQSGTVKGNVFYMSPEQARGLPVDARSDLFSLGLVMFTICSGSTLYTGTSNYTLLTGAAEGLSTAAWDRVRRLPPQVAALLERALQFDPKDRFASAEDFSRALDGTQVGSAAAMQQLMDSLFREQFRDERARFSGSIPPEAGR